MSMYLLLAGTVIILCILLSRFAEKLPVPSLLIFIGLGMCFGVNGFSGIAVCPVKSTKRPIWGRSLSRCPAISAGAR